MQEKIKNIFGENLDVLIDGNLNSNKILIFVHGFGTDKNEGFNMFLDISNHFKSDFITIRFDLSGYGKSEGKDFEFQFQKAAGDVDSIIRFVKKQFKNKEIYILAHSLGTFVVSILSPQNIKKIIFTSIPNSNINFVIQNIKERINLKNGTINENDITIYPRTNGSIQKIGKDFWKTLKSFKPLEYIEDLTIKTDLMIFKPISDEIVGNKYFKEYKLIPNLKYCEILGDHNFTKKRR